VTNTDQTGRVPMATAVIQARMSSTRFAGKILRLIRGRPLLWHIIHRLKKCRLVDKTVIATSIEPSDDAVESFAKDIGVPCYRGSLNNVLERFSGAVELYPNPYIVRICGDSPLIDPPTIDEHIESLIAGDGDYALLEEPEDNIQEGFEALSRRLMTRLVEEAGDDPVAVEHVTGYVKFHPEFCRIINQPLHEDYRVPGSRTSIDTPADMEFVETLYELTNTAAGDLDLIAAVELIRNRPELLEINRHVRQKSGDEPTRRVIIRCDADVEMGFGNLSRCMMLAKAFREQMSWGVTFASPSAAVIERARDENYGLIELEPTDIAGSLAKALDKNRPDAIILDLTDSTSREEVETWRQFTYLITGIDDRSDRRLATDLVFYPPAPELRDLDWGHTQTEVLSGWDWIILGSVPKRPAQTADRNDRPPKVLLTLGGFVPVEMACRWVDIIATLDISFEIEFVVAAGFEDKERLRSRVVQSFPESQFSVDVSDLPERMARSDLVICAFGVTAYEAVAEGCSTLIIARNHNNALSASALQEAGAARALGENDRLSDEEIADDIERLLGSEQERAKIRRRPGELIDHNGAMRIALHVHRKLDEILQGQLDGAEAEQRSNEEIPNRPRKNW